MHRTCVLLREIALAVAMAVACGVVHAAGHEDPAAQYRRLQQSSDDGLVRIACSGRFNNAREKTYVEHGYPTPYKYSYQTDLIYKDFPSKADLATVFPAAASAK